MEMVIFEDSHRQWSSANVQAHLPASIGKEVFMSDSEPEGWSKSRTAAG
jgi:hypothetical protein